VDSASSAAADPLFAPLPFGFGFSDGRDAMETLLGFSIRRTRTLGLGKCLV
jgi:hypothetical protein